MLERAADTFIAAVELIDAEADRLKDKVVRTGRDAALVVGAALGLGLVVLAIATGGVWALATVIGVPGALAAGGALFSLLMLSVMGYLTKSREARGLPPQHGNGTETRSDYAAGQPVEGEPGSPRSRSDRDQASLNGRGRQTQVA